MNRLFRIPIAWNIEDFKKLNYKLDTHKVEEDNKKYIQAGHPKDALTLYNYFEPNTMPEGVDYIKSFFKKYKGLSVAVNLFTPGQYMPIHYDRFDTYKKIYNTDNQIHRFMIMLEDSCPGQMLLIKETVYNKWKAGQVFTWQDDDIHNFYNLSLQNRYAVQLTAHR